MMDTTTSREDFEKWLKLKMPTTYKLAFECGDDDELTNLAKASVLDMRTAWKASRESIVVEMPKRDAVAYTEKDWEGNHHGRGRNDVLDECYPILRSAGIRIKGECE